MLALMLYTEARRSARRGADGSFVPLEEQDTALWDAGAVEEAETMLREASAGGPSGRYQIEAAIQSAHVARRRLGIDNWPAIVALYDHLLALTGSPVVALNRAPRSARSRGPAPRSPRSRPSPTTSGLPTTSRTGPPAGTCSLVPAARPKPARR